MEADNRSAAAAAEAGLKSTHSSETSSLLAVKQDFSRLTSKLSETDSIGSSVMSAVPECEVSTDADIEVSSGVNKPLDVADVTADETETPRHCEMNCEHESQLEHLDQRQPEESCDATSNHLVGLVEPDKSYDSALSHTEGGLQLSHSSGPPDDVMQSDELSEAKLKKASLKHKSVQNKSCANKRLTSSRVKKLQRKIETSPLQHVRTSSGIFVVHEVTQHEVTQLGETLQTDSENILIRDLLRNLTCCISKMCI